MGQTARGAIAAGDQPARSPQQVPLLEQLADEPAQPVVCVAGRGSSGGV